MIGCLVQIQDNGNTGHKEEEERNPETLDAFLTRIRLINQTQDTQEKRQHVVNIMPLVICYLGRHVILRTNHSFVNRLDTRYPIPMRNLSMTLDIVLTTREIPHEVTPIHEVQLISKKETEVLGKSRLDHRLRFPTVGEFHRLTFDICPFLIRIYMIGITTVHAREKHIQLIDKLVISFMAGNVILILLTRILLDYTCPSRRTLFGYRSTVVSFLYTLHLGNISLPVKKWSLSILLTSQICTQSKNIAWRILIHRRISRSSYQCQSV